MEVRPMVSWSVLLCRLTCSSFHRVRSSTLLNVWFACLSVCSSVTLLYNFNTTQTCDRVVFTKDSVKMLQKFRMTSSRSIIRGEPAASLLSVFTNRTHDQQAINIHTYRHGCQL